MILAVQQESDHTSDHLAGEIREILKAWDILISEIQGLVADNTNSMPALARALGVVFKGCDAHKLNLVVKHAKSVAATIDAVGEIVKYFNKSAQATEEVKEAQQLAGREPLSLVKRNRTRWNLVLHLTTAQTRIVGELLPALQPFDDATVCTQWNFICNLFCCSTDYGEPPCGVGLSSEGNLQCS